MLRKVLFVALVLLAIQNWDAVKNFLSPPPDFAAAHDGKVILYATSWCGYCDQARKLLKGNGIDYFEYDIERSEEGSRQYRALGANGVPVLLINRQVIEGYDPERILKLVKSM